MLNMGDKAAAPPLLREAVQGLTAVYMYSAEHPGARHYQDFLNNLAGDSACDSESEGVPEEEIMYQRMAKRRRRE